MKIVVDIFAKRKSMEFHDIHTQAINILPGV